MTSSAENARSDHGDLTGRILDAARRLVLQSGTRKLSLTEVAAVAGVSRQSIYRYFLSKEELIDALGKHEYQRFNAAMERAIEGRTGQARMEAALDVVATVLQDQPPRRTVDLDPRFAHEQIVGALPVITEGLVDVIRRCQRDGMHLAAAPRDLAAAIARTVLSHYTFPDQDAGAARRQIRAIVGLPAD
jgi:AcrR family transcriptional regulator